MQIRDVEAVLVVGPSLGEAAGEQVSHATVIRRAGGSRAAPGASVKAATASYGQCASTSALPRPYLPSLREGPAPNDLLEVM